MRLLKPANALSFLSCSRVRADHAISLTLEHYL
jgi:hypothetical protein